AVTRLLQNLVLRSAKADGVRDYFHVGVIGYGQTVRPGLGGKLPYEILIPISRLSDNPLRIETRTKITPDGAGGVIEQKIKFPVWFDPGADGKTPICEPTAPPGLAGNGIPAYPPYSSPPLLPSLPHPTPPPPN